MRQQLERKSITEEERTEWMDRYRSVLSLGFEAAAALSRVDAGLSILEEAQEVMEVDGFLLSRFMGTILTCGAPFDVLLRFLEV